MTFIYVLITAAVAFLVLLVVAAVCFWAGYRAGKRENMPWMQDEPVVWSQAQANAVARKSRPAAEIVYEASMLDDHTREFTFPLELLVQPPRRAALPNIAVSPLARKPLAGRGVAWNATTPVPVPTDGGRHRYTPGRSTVRPRIPAQLDATRADLSGRRTVLLQAVRETVDV